jgi:excinuclease ABC subunit B
MTGSMQRAIDETNRRRERQIAHNKEHGIVPKSIVKKVADIMDAGYPVPKRARGKVADGKSKYEVLSPEMLMKKAAKLEKQMLKAARDLEFEQAAKLRDEIQMLRAEGLGIPDKKAG